MQASLYPLGPELTPINNQTPAAAPTPKPKAKLPKALMPNSSRLKKIAAASQASTTQTVIVKHIYYHCCCCCARDCR